MGVGTSEGGGVGMLDGTWEGLGVGEIVGIGVGKIVGFCVGGGVGTTLGSGVGLHSHSSGSEMVAMAHFPSAQAVQKRDMMLPEKEHSSHGSGSAMFVSGHSNPAGHGLHPVAT
mmetsp:Transcript_21837/g.39890  ORF Transcript_21837/g.39890 Transcript_21837/m.39890 type:complete len:114 (-) Transcript_21837:2286-2627(-)